MSFITPRTNKQKREKTDWKKREAVRVKEEASRLAYWARPAPEIEADRRRARASLFPPQDILLWYQRGIAQGAGCEGCDFPLERGQGYVCRIPLKGRPLCYCGRCLRRDILGGSSKQTDADDVTKGHKDWLDALFALSPLR